MTVFHEINYETFASVFYDRLFELMPEIHQKFSDMRKQKLMIITALQSIGRGGESLAMQEFAHKLGRLHKSAHLTTAELEIGRQAFSEALDKASNNISNRRKQYYWDAYLQFEAIMLDEIASG